MLLLLPSCANTGAAENGAQDSAKPSKRADIYRNIMPRRPRSKVL